MNKKLITGAVVISVIVLLIGVLRMLWAQKSEQTNQTNTANPELVEKCNNALAYMTFPDGAAADEFLRKCLAGENVLPNQTESTGSELQLTD